MLAGLCVAFAWIQNHLLSEYLNDEGYKIVKRERRSVSAIMREMGHKWTRKAYRMHHESYWKLHGLLFSSNVLGKRKRGKTVNGDILMRHCLCMALYWMAGGNKLDISPNHGVSMDEIISRVWLAVDAVSKYNLLKLPIQTNRDMQQQIANIFTKKSTAKFVNCAVLMGCLYG